MLYGQELNPESYAICLADMLIKGQDASHIVHGNSLSEDGHRRERFHYGLANPPFGVDWSKVEEAVREEHETQGFDGRFGPGLPRKSDGQLLFLLLYVGDSFSDYSVRARRLCSIANTLICFHRASALRIFATLLVYNTRILSQITTN